MNGDNFHPSSYLQFEGVSRFLQHAVRTFIGRGEWRSVPITANKNKHSLAQGFWRILGRNSVFGNIVTSGERHIAHEVL